MIADIQRLESDTEIYNEECIKPTYYAFARMRELISQSAQHLQSAFPMGTVYPDGSGGMRVDWSTNGKELRLIVPSVQGGRQYIWHMNDTEHALVEDVSAQSLGCWLNWFTSDDRSSGK